VSKFKSVIVAIASAVVVCAHAAEPVKIAGIMELSGSGATPGTSFNNGARLAAREINAAGGILGRQIDYETVDTQTNPAVAKALAQKAVDDGAYVVLGPAHSGTALVAMTVTQNAEVTEITGGEAAAITQKNNPYIFRSSFTQEITMPKVVRYMKEYLKANTVAMVYSNNDNGKGGRDYFVKALDAAGMKLAADIPTEPQQVDFAAAVLKAKQSGADALFLYTLEEESARMIRELRKQGYDKSIVGESQSLSNKTLELAGNAANGLVGHVGLTIDAPNPRIKDFAAKYQKEYGTSSDHNGMKGYISMYVVKAMTEKIGKFDSKALAAAMRGAKISAAQNPGVLMDIGFDKNGDVQRGSFLIKIENGKQIVTGELPADGM